MINVNESIKEAYDKSTIQVDKIIVDNVEYRINNVEYYDDVYEEGNIFGTAIARGLEFEIENVVDLEKKEVQYLTGIKVGDTIQWINLGNFIIQSVEPNDTTNINKVVAMDYMLKTNILYESTLNYSDGTVTLLDVAQEVCTKSGIQLATMDFANCDFIVDSNQFEDNTLNRQVIQAIAQMSGTIAKIKNDNQLYFIPPQTDVRKVITLNNYKEAEIKRLTHPINVVTLGMSNVEGENITLRDEQSIIENGENNLVINDNPFAYSQAKREQLITALFNVVKGFEYKAYTFKCQGLPYLETMDKIQFKDKEGNTYDSYMFRFNYKSPKGLESTIEAPSIIKATVNYQNVPDALEISKRTEILVDKQNQTIESVVSNVAEQNQKISQVTQTVDEINSKISDIADITVTEESYQARCNLDNINESEPIMVKIHPTTQNISYLYPRDNLYPSDDLFMPDRTLLFHNNTTDEDIPYLLPDDLLLYNSTTYDEFYLDYDSQTCKVIKRCGYNADGTVKALSTPVEFPYSYPEIVLPEGDYTISLPGYSNGYLFVRLMSKNIYTTQFYTKAETRSQIQQSASDINLSVDTKLSNYSTTTQMTAAINLKAGEINQTVSTKVGKDEVVSSINQTSESIRINANKVNLDGYVTITGLSGGTTTIDGACLKTGTIDASLCNVTNINASNITTGTISADKISGGSLNLTGKNTTITSTNFSVDANGNITASSGTIGGFTLLSNRIKATDGKCGIASSTFSGDPVIWTGEGDPWNLSDWESKMSFYVTHGGYLKATNANISGVINATSGTFNNCTINSNCTIQGGAVVGTLSGVNVYAQSLTGMDIYSSSFVEAASHFVAQNQTGKDLVLIVKHNDQYWRRLTFKGGILVKVEETW